MHNSGWVTKAELHKTFITSARLSKRLKWKKRLQFAWSNFTKLETSWQPWISWLEKNACMQTLTSHKSAGSSDSVAKCNERKNEKLIKSWRLEVRAAPWMWASVADVQQPGESRIKVVYSQTSKPSNQSSGLGKEGRGRVKKKGGENKCSPTIYKNPNKKDVDLKNIPNPFSDCNTRIWLLLLATNSLID